MTSASSSSSERAPVAVVIPVRNRAHLVGRAVASALAQSLRPAEVVVVDDGSTEDIAAALAGFPGIRLIRQEAAGAYAARNRGISASTQPFIAFLDSDDAWHPRKLELQLPLFDRGSVAAVFGDARIVRTDATGATHETGTTAFERTPPGKCTTADLVYGNCVPFSTLVARRSAFERIGMFDERSRLSTDWRWLVRLTFGAELACVREPVIDYFLHADNWSGSLSRSLVSRVEIFQEELGERPEHAVVLRRILFVLRLRIAVAKVRGRWSAAPAPTVIAAERVRPFEAVRWICAFFAHELTGRSARTLRSAVRRVRRSQGRAPTPL